MNDRLSRLVDVDGSMRMATRGPQQFAASDAAGAGLSVEAGVPAPGLESIHPQYPLRPLLFKKPGASGLRSGGEPLSSDEVSVLDLTQDPSPRFLPKNMLQGGRFQPPLARYGGGKDGGELPEYHQYEDFAGILGDGRLASGSHSDLSVAAASGASEKQVETVCRTCSSGNLSVGEHPGPRIKFMCSFGGKILPRPSDGKLRYAGGETRIVSVRRHTNYADLMRKMTELCGQAMSFKYQLPDEDLDALISVSSDEDLENMMEEYDRLEAAEGSTRLRIFLFSPAEYDVLHLSDTADRRNTDQIYVDAINGIAEAGSGSRKHIDIVSVSSSNNLIGLEVSQAWNAALMSETVSVALLAPPVPQGAVASLVQSIPVVMPLPSKQVLARISSAPLSGPSSPPMSSQLSQARQSTIPDMPLHFFSDPMGRVPVVHQYEAVRPDGTYQDVDGVGSATSSVNSQHDFHYRMRVPDSPTKAQQEAMMAFGNHQDQLYRAEQWRMADVMMPRVDSHGMMPHVDSHGRMPRVDSHGKLMPLQEQHMELVAQPGAADKRLETHLPDTLFPPSDLQSLVTQEQQQLQLSQATWQHPLDAHWEGYRRMDPMQQSALETVYTQQQALHQHQNIVSQLYPLSGTSAHEAAAFKQMEQSLQQEDALTGQLPYKSIAPQISGTQSVFGVASGPTFHIGSAPPSPRVGSLENIGKQSGGQQHVQALQGVNEGFVDQPYNRTVRPHNDQANRVLKPSNLPPDSREQVLLGEDQFAHQQVSTPFINLEKLPQEQRGDAIHTKYETPQSQSYHSDGLTQPMVPPYPGVSVYQDGLAAFQDRVISRRDNQEQLLQPGEQLPVHPRYKDRQEGVDRILQRRNNDLDEARPRVGGWTQMGQMDSKGELSSGLGPSGNADKLWANSPGLQFLEESDASFVGADPYLTAQSKSDQFDPQGSDPSHLRASLLPSGVGVHLPTLGRALFSDSSQPAYLPGRLEGDGLPAQVTTRAGTKILAASTFPSSFNETPSVHPASTATRRLSDEKAGGFMPTQIAPQLTSFLPNTLPSTSNSESLFLAKMEEGRWDGDFDSDVTRFDLSGHNSGGDLSEDALEHIADLNLDSELSRPASVSEGPGDATAVSMHAISKQASTKSLIDDDTFVPPYETLQVHTQANVSMGTSYPVTLATLAMGLDTFPSEIDLSCGSSASVAGGSSFAGPQSTSLVDEAFTASSCLASAVVDPSDVKNLKSRPRDILVEGANVREDTAVPYKSEAISTPGGIPLNLMCVSKELEGKGLFPIFDSDSAQEEHGHDVHVLAHIGNVEREDEDVKGDLEHVAKNVAAAVFQPTIYSAPTLSIQNWEDTLAQTELEEQVVKESLPAEKSLDDVKLNIVEKEVTFQEIKIGIEEANKDGLRVNKPTNPAALAEAEAIARGLQTIRNSDLEELRELGSGTFGTVYHGKWRGTDVAIKRIKSSCFTGRQSERERLMADFWREAFILGQLHHPNVVAFYGVVPDGPGGTLATVTEYMVNGSLKQVLQKKDRTIDRRKRLLITMDAAFGMEYLHGKNIVHFDLKCENLLVNMRDPQRPICKVGDLGLSKVKQQTMVSGGVRGTLPWMAPELLNGSSSLVSEKVDVFSFGIVMWELLTGEEPYANMHYGAIIGGIVNNTLRPPVPSWCDPSWRLLMERCWSADPGERPSFSEIAGELRAMATLANPRVQAQAHISGAAGV